ncbi:MULTISPECIES: hypothetical protein [unclassified Rhizobacter]|uniref:hypothetical protein n=1 Tax=unclassified Rhizobacter TaxID=2640088 RepID=UPI000A5FCDE3|nr:MULTISPECIES: hypothetical protein [unclassified Rhizobacter]
MHPLLGWMFVLFGGAFFVLACRMMTPGLTYLRLDSEGFELKSGRVRRKTKWQDVKSFRRASLGTAGSVIAIEYHPTYTKESKARSFAKVVVGIEDFIPNAYNVTLETLEKELRAWLAYYGKSGH